MTIHWKAVEQYFTVVLFVSFYPLCNFGKLINFGLGTVKGLSFKNTLDISFNRILHEMTIASGRQERQAEPFFCPLRW